MFHSEIYVCYPSHSPFAGQVVCAGIRWRNLCDLRRARVPRPTGAYTLNPRLLDVFGDDIRDPLADHPFVRTDSFHSLP